jgi:tetratricopeptide (TPR) repeat protein/CHAT domain-containing protein
MMPNAVARRLAAQVIAAVVCAGLLAPLARAQGPGDADVARLYQAGRYAEAIEVAKRVIAIRESTLGTNHLSVAASINNLANLYLLVGRDGEVEPLLRRSLAIHQAALGPDHPNVGTVLNNLGNLYWTKGRYAEAEPIYRRSLAIRERHLGPAHPDVAASLNNLAQLYRAQDRYAEAEPLVRRSLAIYERTLGPDHPTVAGALNALADLYRLLGRHAEAEPLLRRSLASRERALGPQHPDVAMTLSSLALLYGTLGRHADAEALYRRSLAITEKALGPDHADVSTLLSGLAESYRTQGRYTEAEPLIRRSLAIAEKTQGPNHPGVANSLNSLADLYWARGRYSEAEALYRRSIAIREKALGPDNLGLGRAFNNLANLYWAQGRHAEAEPLYHRALAIREKALGAAHPDVGTTLMNLANLYWAQRRFAEAEPLYRRSLAITEKALGSAHPDVGTALNNLAALYRDQRRYAEAEPLYRRSLAVLEKALGHNHPHVAESLNSLAWLGYDQGNWASAVDHWRRSTAIIRHRAQRGLASAAEDAAKGEAQRSSRQFVGLVKATYHLVAGGRASGSLAADMFETAQWARDSDAAGSLAQMAARSASGSSELADLVRRRQDLVREANAKEKQLIAANAQGLAPDVGKAQAAHVADLHARLEAITQQLDQRFPDYAALASPVPASVADVQAQLRPDEAMLLFLDTPEGKPLPEETFIWIVTKSDLRWVRSDLGTAALQREVEALRCGLDAAAWDGSGAQKCAAALNMAATGKTPEPLPFDHARAHRLYVTLLGKAQDLIQGKHLLIVPSGPLTQLPSQVLVTQPPVSKDHRTVVWLARAHALTVLPAPSSLMAVRRVGRPSAAPRAMVGFGNPLLDGPSAAFTDLARLARAKQRCPEAPAQPLARLANHRGGVRAIETRNGLANVATVRMQVPLPETADELCSVARDLNAAQRDLHLGTQATEREVTRLSATGELAQYRLIHFATHGVLAGELDGTHEPGLILTPPAIASAEDDGFLSASEIAGLKLDADWVVLSACNTAAGAARNAEALSGLGRAFIYAGTRALLVSHWAVESNATVKLITGAVSDMARDPDVGRAEAVRRAMLALIDKGTSEEAHPASWAPFVVVGEGSRFDVRSHPLPYRARPSPSAGSPSARETPAPGARATDTQDGEQQPYRLAAPPPPRDAAPATAFPAPKDTAQRFRVVPNLSGGFLTVRESPSADAPEVARLRAGTGGLTKLSCADARWCRMARDGRDLGYVNVSFLIAEDTPAVARPSDTICRPIDSAPQGRFEAFGFKRDDLLNVRAEPHGSAAVLGKIGPNATDIDVGPCTNGWCLVRHGGVCGWVSSRYLRHGKTGRKPAE